MAAAFGYAFVNGRPRLIVTGWDADRMGCGLNETTKDYPALYWPEIPSLSALNKTLAGDPTAIFDTLKHGVCVK